MNLCFYSDFYVLVGHAKPAEEDKEVWKLESLRDDIARVIKLKDPTSSSR